VNLLKIINDKLVDTFSIDNQVVRGGGEMKLVVCEKCGANDFLEVDEFMICKYCHSKYSTREIAERNKSKVTPAASVSFGDSTQRLLDKAEKCWKSGDKTRAKRLYSQILEIDPLNQVARKRI
jgi:uncharacterized Zn finger protein (UPF0148 family)